MNEWIKVNGATLTGWLATMLAVVFGFGMSAAQMQGSVSEIQADVMETRQDTAKNREDIIYSWGSNAGTQTASWHVVVSNASGVVDVGDGVTIAVTDSD